TTLRNDPDGTATGNARKPQRHLGELRLTLAPETGVEPSESPDAGATRPSLPARTPTGGAALAGREDPLGEAGRRAWGGRSGRSGADGVTSIASFTAARGAARAEGPGRTSRHRHTPVSPWRTRCWLPGGIEVEPSLPYRAGRAVPPTSRRFGVR